MEANASFLRAARAGTLDKVLECLDQDDADISACNPVCIIVCCTNTIGAMGPWYSQHSSAIVLELRCTYSTVSLIMEAPLPDHQRTKVYLYKSW